MNRGSLDKNSTTLLIKQWKSATPKTTFCYRHHGVNMNTQKYRKPFPNKISHIELQFDVHDVPKNYLEVTKTSLSKISGQLGHPVGYG